MQEVNEDTFSKEVLDSDKTVVVDFFATWCGPCRAMTPLLEKLDKELPDVKFVKVDIDNNPDLATKYQVDKIPYFVFFQDGEPYEKVVGVLKEDKLREIVSK
jgi:thioredoxin 1